MAKQIKGIEDLTPDPRNSNKGSERGYRILDDSMSKYGAGRSILTDKNGVVIAGNKTLEAAIEANMDIEVVHTDGNKLVVVQRDDLDLDNDTKARPLAYADNRAADFNEYDSDKILEDLTRGVDLKGLFEDFELKDLGIDTGEDDTELPEAQMDKADELQKKWQVKTGDIWQIGPHRLGCGDSTDTPTTEKLMGGIQTNCVLTDPPYGLNQPGVPHDTPEENNALINGVVSNLPICDGVIVAFQSTRTFPTWLDAIRKNGYKFERILSLYKEAQCTYPWRGWILISESILVSSIGEPHWNEIKPYVHDAYKVSEVSGELSPELGWHGSVKPLMVVKDILSRICFEEDYVYDPFLGSGTTMVAAEQLGRICFGIEIYPAYCAVILERMSEMGLTPERVTDGK